MSVRKVYSVIVDGRTVFIGSYGKALDVYNSFCNYRDFFKVHIDISVAFQP